MMFDKTCQSLDIKHDFNGSVLDVLIRMADGRHSSLHHRTYSQCLAAIRGDSVLVRDLNSKRINELEEESKLGQESFVVRCTVIVMLFNAL